jgi:hypothetical protein
VADRGHKFSAPMDRSEVLVHIIGGTPRQIMTDVIGTGLDLDAGTEVMLKSAGN